MRGDRAGSPGFRYASSGLLAKLNALRAKLSLGRLGPEEASDEFAAIMTLDASELPMAAREQT